MKKYLLSLVLIASLGVAAFAQLNPGNFEMRLFELNGTQLAVQMRGIMEPSLPHSDGVCFLGGSNSICVDLTFSVQTSDPDGNVATNINAALALPCNFGQSGYGIADAGAPIDYEGTGVFLHGFAAGNFTPFDFPEDWILNEWVTVCTLNIANIAPEDIELVSFNEYGAIFDPNLGIDEGGGITDYTPEIVGVLPLSLLAFNADKYGERSALVSWRTANEVNTSHFMVERSLDRYNWQEVGKVQAAGESTATRNYQFVDENVYDGRKPNARFYYRLNMVDRDGRAQKSSIDVVQFSNGDVSGVSVFVFPNPSTDGVNVELNYTEETASPAEFLMYNELGQVIYKQNVPEGSTFEFIDFSKANISSGAYTLQVLDTVNGIISTEKLIVQR